MNIRLLPGTASNRVSEPKRKKMKELPTLTVSSRRCLLLQLQLQARICGYAAAEGSAGPNRKKLRRPICAHRLLCCGGQGRAVRLRHRRQGSRKPHAISAQYVLLSLHLIHRLAALGRQSFRCGFPLAPAQGAKGFEIEPFSNLQHTKCSLLLTGREQTSFYFGPFLSM